MKKISIFAVFLLFFAPSFVLAQSSEEGILSDVFRFSPNINITEPIPRDLIAAGGTIVISENVGQDVFAVGSTVLIKKDVFGDVRAVGNRLVINGLVGGNVALLGQVVEIGEDAQISGSVRIHAQKVVINGLIGQEAVIMAQELEQNGSIVGSLQYEKTEQNVSHVGFGWFFRLAGLFGMLVVGLVLASAWPKTVRSSIFSSMENPTKDIIWGFLGLIGIPIISLVLLLTIIGFPLGLILIAFYIIALYFAQVLVGIMIGTYIIGVFKGKEKAQKFSLVWTMVVGIIVLWLIVGIPSLGWIIRLMAVILGFGILARIKLGVYKKMES